MVRSEAEEVRRGLGVRERVHSKQHLCPCFLFVEEGTHRAPTHRRYLNLEECAILSFCSKMRSLDGGALMPRLLPLVLAVLLCGAASQAEDVKLREQAVELMEIARAASHPGVLRNFEQTVAFRVHEPDGSVQEGSCSRVSAWQQAIATSTPSAITGM
jgi:hypothetical protein